MASETLSFDIFANDRASETFRRLGLAASNAAGDVRTLGDRLDKLGTKVATARVGLKGNKEANVELDKLDVKLIKLGKKVADPNITVEGKIKALADIAAVELAMDKLNKKFARPNLVARAAGGAAGAGFLQSSGLGIAAALSPTLIPIAAALSGAVAAIGVSFGAAAVGAGAFGLLAKSALTQASTAANAVQTAQNQYKASLIAIHQQYAANAAAATTHAQKAAALATEQKALTAAGIAQTKAINLAYAQMTPAQIALSKSVGQLSDAWQKVQQATQPAISGALVPWLKDLSLLMKDLEPLVRPVADQFAFFGQTLHQYLSSGAGSTELHHMATELGRFSAVQLGSIVNFIVDIGKGIFNLGRDLAAHHVDFYAFGLDLQKWGTAFASWSSSAKARKEVGDFLAAIRKNGSLVGGILRDLAKYLPGIFAGASTAGQLELQALSSFLGVVAKLPPGVAKPLAEIAGAMLLLSKTGVLKVGLKLTGALAEHPTAFGFTLGAVLAGAIIAGVNSKRPGHGGQTWWQSFGPPSKAQQQTWLNSWSGLGDRIVQIADDVRHGVAQAWDVLFQHTLASTKQGDHDIAVEFDKLRHGTAAIFDGLRRDIASAWDTIWSNTAAAVRSGVGTVVAWFKGLPGKVLAALRGLGSSLFSFGKSALSDFLRGLQSIGGSIISWAKNFFGGLVKAIGSFLHMSPPHPGSAFFDLGANMMAHLEAGIKSRAQAVRRATQAAAGGGAHGGPTSASAAQAQAYARSRLAAYGWGASQMGPLIALWNQESGWNRLARNPSSGAYGIPQALPASKMGAAANPPLSSAAAQINWGLGYIRGRYGSPAAAEAHERAFNWYGSGLQGGIFTRPTIIGVGDRPERVDITPMASPNRGGGAAVKVQMEWVGGNAGDALLQWIQKNVRIRGGGDVQKAFGRP